jgi:succinylglutamate desuccinylase
MKPERKKDIDYFNQHSLSSDGIITVESENFKPGDPVLVIIGATHGNEPCGVKAIIKFHKLIYKNIKKLLFGKVILVIGNPKAYIQDKRYIDQDLNRSFEPNNKFSNNYEGIRSKKLSDIFQNEKNIISALDIHTVSKGENQLVVYNKNLKKCFQLARNFSPISNHLSYHSQHIPGLLIDSINRNGSYGIALECGNNQGTNSTNVALYHIYSLLHHFKFMNNSTELQELNQYVESSDNIYQYETIQPIIPQKNFAFTQDFATGAKLVKGELFAKSNNKTIYAPDDCYIVMPTKFVKETDEDAGFLCHLNLLSA